MPFLFILLRKINCYLKLIVAGFFLSACSHHPTIEQQSNAFIHHHAGDVAAQNNIATDNATDNATESLAALVQSEQWWQLFQNKELEQLVHAALNNNFQLTATLARVESAKAQLMIAEADLYPALNFTASGTSQFESFDKINPASLGLSSSWEIDLWGKISALEKKAQWDLVSRQALHKIKLNAVAGGVVTTWLNWQAEAYKQNLLNEQYQRVQTALNVIERRFAMGKNSVTDIWQQQRLLESITSSQVSNQARLRNFQKQLALWLGITEAKLTPLLSTSLPDIRVIPEQTLPLQVLQYRPDVQQAYANLHADNELLAAAVSEQFPRLTLRANYTTSQNNTRELFDDWLGNLVASLTMPLFNAGAIQQKIKQREYTLQAALADFKQVWLEAIYEVESSLVTEQQLYRLAEQLDIQLQLAQQTERVTSLQYLNGKTRYLSLLRAQETSLSLERQAIDAKKNLLINRVKIYRELSHGNLTANHDFNPISFFTSSSKPQANHQVVK